MTKLKKILLLLVAVSFAVTLFCALMHDQFGLELWNPITILLIFLLLMSNLPMLGPHKLSTACMGMGFLCLVIGEGMHFVNHFILHSDPYSDLIRFIYVSPTFFFALNETLFMHYKLAGNRRELSHLFANTFCVASIGFVLIYKFFLQTVGSIQTPDQLSYLVFIFIAFYVCMMSLQTFYLVGWEQILRGTMLTTIAMLIYEIMDLHYLYTESIGIAPDSNTGDILYTFLTFIMALGITIQVSKQYVFHFRRLTYSEGSLRRGLILCIMGIALAVLMSFIRLLTFTEASNIIIVLMAYLIMGYLLYTGELNDRQNSMLAVMVNQKTKELEETNDQLRVAKAAAEEASRAKSDFLANMSHEIRTPINAILGMDEMILREAKDPVLRKYAVNIQRAGKALLAQVNDVLDFSKIEAGKMELFPDEYNLALEISDMVRMTESRAAAKGLSFTADVDRNAPRILYGDNARIRQVILNLLSNAVKYTKEGCITLSVRYRKVSEDEVDLQIATIDTGIGIRKEDMDKLFFAFERIDENRNRTIEGTGLGMNIVWNLLQLMGSHLEAESEYGKGSRFSFTIRQKVIDWEPVGDFAKVIEEQDSSTERYHSAFTAPRAHILLVDDTEMNLIVTKGLLKNTFMQIDTASDGKQGLSLTEQTEYDALLIDHRMPVMDGIEMIRRLRSSGSNRNAAKPCIALTANAVAGAREEYISAGFDDYLIKPVNGARLEETLMKYLPQEKIVPSGASRSEIAEGNPALTTLEEKGYLDVKEGIEYAGDIDLYLVALRFFFNTIDDRIDEIRRYYRDEDWENYQTKVHALKSSARTIGAGELSNRARALELAVKDEDMVYVREHTGDVLAFYGSYKKKLQEAITEDREL